MSNKENATVDIQEKKTNVPTMSRLPGVALQRGAKISTQLDLAGKVNLKRKAEAENTSTITSNTVKSIFKANGDKEPRDIKNTSRTGVTKARVPTIPEAKPVTRATSAIKKVGVVANTAAKKAASGLVSDSRNKTSVVSKAVSVPVAQPATKKRKEYDIKGRLQDLEEQHHSTSKQLSDSNNLIESMTAKLDDSQKTISDLMEFKYGLENKVQAKEHEKSIAEQELMSIKEAHEELKKKNQLEITSLVSEHKIAIDSLTTEFNKLKTEFQGSQAECTQYKITISTQAASQYALESERNLLKTKLEASENVSTEKSLKIADLEAEKELLIKKIEDMELKMHEEEVIRKFLHNEIQELKGNIRVFCRVRPLLENESNDTTSSSIMSFPPDKQDSIELCQSIESASGNRQSKTYPFSFDKVFQHSAQQADVFKEISQLVQSALDGYNICIFAYGQTGSGKTFTMEGPGNIRDLSDDKAGMIPRAVHQIYAAAETLQKKGWTYSMEAQFLEIYNETLRDLLSNDGEVKKHEIKHDHHKGHTNVTDATNIKVKTPDEVFSLLEIAAKNRAVAATNSNERSSRSHSVFTLRISGVNSVTEETTSGVLNLIDLAGSERLASSGSTGDRLKETQAINKSLSSLGDVIYALSNKDSHIPYRNSKLTYLLQHSLGGNSKTLMFVNISPLPASLQETLCSLRFATKVNACQIGTARKQVMK